MCSEMMLTANLLFYLFIYLKHDLLEDDPEYLITGTHAYPSGPGEYHFFN